MQLITSQTLRVPHGTLHLEHIGVGEEPLEPQAPRAPDPPRGKIQIVTCDVQDARDKLLYFANKCLLRNY